MYRSLIGVNLLSCVPFIQFVLSITTIAHGSTSPTSEEQRGLTLCVSSLCSAVYVVVAKVGDRCVTKDDCDEDECCVSGIFSIPTGKCKKLKIKDDWCAPKVGERDRYFHMCPCGEGLSCEAEETEVLEGG
ncbi:hypothetical protein NPIL_341971, partial [Nephila pilipes]